MWLRASVGRFACRNAGLRRPGLGTGPSLHPATSELPTGARTEIRSWTEGGSLLWVIAHSPLVRDARRRQVQ
jgi:hypothetical protein